MGAGVLAGPHTYKQGGTGQIVRFRSSLGCGDHEIVEFRSLQGGNEAKRQDHNPGVQESRVVHVQMSAWKNPMRYSPRDKRVQNNWLIFKDLLQAQKWSPSKCRT